MLSDLARCREIALPEAEKAEWGWRMASRSWQQVKGIFIDHVFTDDKEEIEFYKIIKPAFTGYIEYYSILHAALELIGEPCNCYQFWDQESWRLQRFMELHRDFVEYYTSGCTCHDLQYFTAVHYDPDALPHPYDIDGNCISSHDHLVASLLGEEMYHGYVKEKLAYQ